MCDILVFWTCVTFNFDYQQLSARLKFYETAYQQQQQQQQQQPSYNRLQQPAKPHKPDTWVGEATKREKTQKEEKKAKKKEEVKSSLTNLTRESTNQQKVRIVATLLFAQVRLKLINLLLTPVLYFIVTQKSYATMHGPPNCPVMSHVLSSESTGVHGELNI